jgi:hypothetical protein
MHTTQTGTLSFVSQEYMYRVIDESYYFFRMTDADLSARKCRSIEEYIAHYKSHVQEFSAHERDALKDLVAMCDNHLRNTKHLKNIPWKFAKVDGHIENGFPHTLQDTIVLSNTFFHMNRHDQVVTLIHEKIHVYQRMYPLQTHRLITDFLGYHIADTLKNHPLSRNNPDINNFIYAKHGVSTAMIYTDSKPTDITHARVCKIVGKQEYEPILHKDVGLPNDVSQIEHPYEVMASYCPLLLTSSRDGVDTTHEVYEQVQRWMSLYL